MITDSVFGGFLMPLSTPDLQEFEDISLPSASGFFDVVVEQDPLQMPNNTSQG